MQFYFQKQLGMGADASKYGAGLLQVALAAGMPFGGWLSGRLANAFGVRRGRAFVSGGGMVASAALLGLGVLSKEPAWIVLPLTIAARSAPGSYLR